jgi:hypothetical protein
MKTQREMRKAFWNELKKYIPELYAKGKRSKRQNEQIADIRITFCVWLDAQNITEKQKQNWTL